MTTLTHTRTETSVRVERTGDGGRVRVTSRARGGTDHPVIRPVLLASDADSARISLVPEGALLLDGDAVAISVGVGPGATLHLTEPAGTVAYNMRGGCATWDVRIVLAAGATLHWWGEPFVAAAGSDTTWTTRIILGQDARLLLRETLVLGRHGEQPGRLRHTLDVRRAGDVPVLVDSLNLAPGRTGLLLGGMRAMRTTLAIGLDSDARGTRFDLEDGGTLIRSLADEMHQL